MPRDELHIIITVVSLLKVSFYFAFFLSCLGIFAIIHAQKNWFAHICSPKICRKYINTQE